jgi:hypothetical protein
MRIDILKTLLFFSIALFLVGCANSQGVDRNVPNSKNQEQQPGNTQKIIPQENRTILNKTSEWFPHEITWIPDENQTDEALKEIFNFLHSPPQEYKKYSETEIGKIRDNLPNYKVQFIGITVDGQKRIHCNFFPASDDELFDWKNSYIFVIDGGFSFWRIEYDLNTKKCLNFESNGYA